MVMEESGVPHKHRLTHYQFRKQIAMEWVRSDEPSMKERRRQQEQKKRQAQQISGELEAEHAAQEGKRKRRKATTKYATPADKKESATSAADSTEKTSTLKDSTILASHGPLAKRLDRFVGHFPEMPDGRRKCALHRWAADIELKSHVYKCSHCKLHLCIPCFQTFHRVHDLVGRKSYLCEQFKAAKTAESKKKTPPSAASKK